MPIQINPLPPVEELRRLFNYDPETGILTNAITRSSRALEGRIAGTKATGYWRVNLNWQWYAVHRIAWKMHYGSDPKAHIDHINGNPLDNRISNLRDVDVVDNQRNRKRLNADNKTGIRGVFWNKEKNNFRATKPKGKNNQHKSGYLTSGSLLDCAAARISLENKLGIAA